MIDIATSVWSILQMASFVVMWGCIALLILKTFMNFCVPYAMIREALQRPKQRHGWSLFILLDIALVFLASIASLAAGETGLVSPWRILIYGACAIIASHIHLFVVLFGAGCMGWFSQLDKKEKPEQ